MGKAAQVSEPKQLIFPFFLTDQVNKGNLTIEYCPSSEMIANFISKLLQGQLFLKFKKAIMGN